MKLTRYILIVIAFAGVLATGCVKDPEVLPVAVNAGNSQTIKLPVNSVTLNGSVKSGQTPATNYLWALVSGPSVPVFDHNNSAVTRISGLIEGTYVLLFQATNSFGNIGQDTTSVIVKAQEVKTLVLQPANSITEGNPNSYYPTGSGNGITQFSAIAWTHSGTSEILRTYLKFDYSGLALNPNIIKATLTLSATLTPNAGNGTDAQFGPQNACSVQRVSSDWNLASLNWNNQPTSSNQNAIVIPQSTSSFENDVIDVTQLVKDMVATNNYGFFIRLQNESVYNSRQYASSFYPDAARHPKLVITYQ